MNLKEEIEKDEEYTLSDDELDELIENNNMGKITLKRYRVAICKETKLPVIQIKEDRWICLHYHNNELDRVAVEAFLAGKGELNRLKKLYK